MIRYLNWFITTAFVTILFLIGLAITIPAYSSNINDSYLHGIIMFGAAAVAFGIGFVATILFRVEINQTHVTFKFGNKIIKEIKWNNATIEIHYFRGGSTLYLITENETYSFFISRKIKKCLEEKAPEYVLKKIKDSYK